MASSAGVSPGIVGRIMSEPFFTACRARALNVNKQQHPHTRECTMTKRGWKQMLDGWPWYSGEGNFQIFPNSEFMPPVRLGRKPYGTWDTLPLQEDDPWG